MKLHIDNSLQLRDIQNEFSNYFPNLRLEFYLNPTTRLRLPLDCNLSNCREILREGELFISEQERVYELEQELSMCFGLHANVLIKQNNGWQKTNNCALSLADQAKYVS